MKIDDIPFQYAYCYATAKQCEQSNRCLRSHAARMNEEDLAMPREVLSCITPAYVNRVSAGETCIHFRSDTPIALKKHLFLEQMAAELFLSL